MIDNTVDNQTRIKDLLLQKKQLEELIQEMRKKRHYGMDDDRAEDIVEEYYRELLEVERELEFLKRN